MKYYYYITNNNGNIRYYINININRNIISFKNDTEKAVLLQVKGLMKTIIKLQVETFCTRFDHAPSKDVQCMRGSKYGAPERLCGDTLKRNELKVYLSLKEKEFHKKLRLVSGTQFDL